MARIAVTGATGFVGGHLVRELLNRGHTVRSLVRTEGTAPQGSDEIALGDFTLGPDWTQALEGQDVVICLAARVHVMNESSEDPLAEYRRVNVEVTEAIANGAVEANVRRLVFLSSIKVNGEATSPSHPYTAVDPPQPEDAYGISKWEAEQKLHEVHRKAGIEVVIVRSPLVYGPGVGGNFFRMLRMVDSGFPLPFASVNNKRAMISVENLTDALIAACISDGISNSLLLVNDPESLSTAGLMRFIADGLGKRNRQIPVPVPLLEFALRALGRGSEARRLLGSLDIEVSSEPPGLAWLPPYKTRESLAKTTAWYRQHVHNSA